METHKKAKIPDKQTMACLDELYWYNDKDKNSITNMLDVRTEIIKKEQKNTWRGACRWDL